VEALFEAETQNHGDEADEAREAHDEETVRSIKAQAINFARDNFGIMISPAEEKTAMGLFTKVRSAL
jgi:hypothetical protein